MNDANRHSRVVLHHVLKFFQRRNTVAPAPPKSLDWLTWDENAECVV